MNEIEKYRLHFQRYGDVESAIKFVSVQQKGKENTYKEMFSLLKPIFEALSLGIQPQYELINKIDLLEFKFEVMNVIHWMMDSDRADMKTTAIDLMGYLGNEDYIQMLLECLSSAEEWIRIHTVKALTHFEGMEAMEALIKALDDHSIQVKRAAVQGLVSRNENDSIPHLVALRDDPDPLVRRLVREIRLKR